MICNIWIIEKTKNTQTRWESRKTHRLLDGQIPFGFFLFKEVRMVKHGYWHKKSRLTSEAVHTQNYSPGKRMCLGGCEKMFYSQGKHNRVCDACKKRRKRPLLSLKEISSIQKIRVGDGMDKGGFSCLKGVRNDSL